MSELYIVDNDREQLDEQLKQAKRDKFVALTVRLLGVRGYVFVESDAPYQGVIESHYLPQPIVLDDTPQKKRLVVDRLSPSFNTSLENEPDHSARVAEGQCFTDNETTSKKAFLIIPKDPTDPAELEVFNSEEVLPDN